MVDTATRSLSEDDMTINLIACVDTETQGLDPKEHRVIELGCVLYSVRHATIVESWATLIADDANQAEAINRIPTEALKDHGRARDNALTVLSKLVARSDVWVAHRAEFDAGFLPDLQRPMVCSKFDVEWPHSKLGASCVEMALAHGVPVVSAHRAMTDCMLIAKTLEAVQKSGHDMQAMFARAMRPRATFEIADRSFDAARNAKAKEIGFRWEDPPKRWVKRMAREDVAGLPFEVREVS